MMMAAKRERPNSLNTLTLCLYREQINWNKIGNLFKYVTYVPVYPRLCESIEYTQWIDHQWMLENTIKLKCSRSFNGLNMVVVGAHFFCVTTLEIGFTSIHWGSFQRACECVLSVTQLAFSTESYQISNKHKVKSKCFLLPKISKFSIWSMVQQFLQSLLLRPPPSRADKNFLSMWRKMLENPNPNPGKDWTIDLCYVEFWIRIKLYRLREMQRHSQIMLNGWSLFQKLFAKTCIWYTTAPLNTIICTHNAIRGIPSAYEPYIHALVKMNEYTFVICMHEMWLCVHLEICMHEHWTPSQAQAQAQDSE